MAIEVAPVRAYIFGFQFIYGSFTHHKILNITFIF